MYLKVKKKRRVYSFAMFTSHSNFQPQPHLKYEEFLLSCVAFH